MVLLVMVSKQETQLSLFTATYTYTFAGKMSLQTLHLEIVQLSDLCSIKPSYNIGYMSFKFQPVVLLLQFAFDFNNKTSS